MREKWAMFDLQLSGKCETQIKRVEMIGCFTGFTAIYKALGMLETSGGRQAGMPVPLRIR